MPHQHPGTCQSYGQNFSLSTKGGEKERTTNALHRLAERVERICGRLAAPLLVVVVGGAEIRDFDDDAVERAREVRRVRVMGARHQEAASAGVPGAGARRGPVGKLVHRGCEAGGLHTTRCGDTLFSVCALVEVQ